MYNIHGFNKRPVHPFLQEVSTSPTRSNIAFKYKQNMDTHFCQN